MLVALLTLLTLAEAARLPLKPFPVVAKRQDNTTYTQHKCDQAVTDITNSPQDRWNNADTEDAWTAGVNYYKSTCKPKNIGFAPCLSNFYGGPEGYQCQTTEGGSCYTDIGCKDVNYDAGYLILNSLVQVNTIQGSIYQATVDANVQILNNINSFSSTFSPQTDDDNILLEILNAFSLIVGLGSAVAWNKLLLSVSWFADSAFRGIAKDSSNAIVTYSAAEGRAHIPPQQAVTQQLQAAVGAFSTGIEDSVSSFTQDIFNGDDNNIDALHSIITGGVMLELSNSTFQDLQYEAQKTLYSQMVPLAWRKDNDVQHPFVLSVSGDCTPGQAVPCSADIQGRQGFSDDDCAASGVCLNGQVFYLANMQTVLVDEESDSYTWGLLPLPGGNRGNMNGDKHQWGGLLMEDIAQSSYSGYQANGNKNGYTPSDDGKETGQTTDLVFQNGVQTPGFIHVPLCFTVDLDCGMDGGDNCKSNDEDNPYYPCSMTSGS